MHRTANHHFFWHAEQLSNICNQEQQLQQQPQQQQQQQHPQQQQQMSSKKFNNNQQRRRRRRGSGCNGVGGHFASIWCISLAILICIAQQTNAVPTDSLAAGTLQHTVTTSSRDAPQQLAASIASSTETPLEQQQPPQGQCLLDGAWVPETTAHCEKQTSCRAIQRPGHCCPAYKCDCEKDGKTYANGYKLVDPDTPCTVCYCKGGEIVCSSVTCFRRDDCKPKYVAGRCCPEYDNCPILENNPPSLDDRSSTTAPRTTAPKLAPVLPPAGYNWNITIKEITKPTEIRFTDENKVKSSIPIRKVTATTDAPTGTQATTTSRGQTMQPPLSSTTAATTTTTLGSTTTAANATAAALTTTLASNITAAANVTQVFHDSQCPEETHYTERPPVTQSSNRVEQQVAAGLQPLEPQDPSKVNIKREYTTVATTTDLSSTAKNDEESLSMAAGAGFVHNGFSDALVDDSNVELEPETAGSDNIYHIISTTVGPSGSSTARQVTTDAPGDFVNSSSSTEAELKDYSTQEFSSSAPDMSSTTIPTHHMDAEEDVQQVESNPAYPSLPGEEFSLRDVNFPLVELEDVAEAEAKDEPRSIAGAFEAPKLDKLLPESMLDGSGSGSGDMELNYAASTTERMQPAASSQSNQIMVQPMYSAEDSSAETRIQKVNDFQLEQLKNETSGETILETDSLEALMSSGSGSGSGSGELPMLPQQRQREYTTPSSKRISNLDIDELGSGSGQMGNNVAVDPKSDAESLKLDDSQENGDVSKTSNDDKKAARLEKSFVERAAVEELGPRIERLYLQRIY